MFRKNPPRHQAVLFFNWVKSAEQELKRGTASQELLLKPSSERKTFSEEVVKHCVQNMTMLYLMKNDPTLSCTVNVTSFVFFLLSRAIMTLAMLL